MKRTESRFLSQKKPSPTMNTFSFESQLIMKRVSFFLLIKGPSGPGSPARVQDPGADAVPHAGDRGGRGRRPRPLAVRTLQLCLRPPRHRLFRPILSGEVCNKAGSIPKMWESESTVNRFPIVNNRFFFTIPRPKMTKKN